jgi:GNAT superfamily N-acetyltransferase
MDDIVLDSDIESGAWPNQFNNSWANIFQDDISEDTILCLYFNEENEYGTINELGKLEELPDAYVSWDRNGICTQLFVKKQLRRKGIGTALCAYARSYAYSNGIIFSAPQKMSINAKMMYESICEKYGEPDTYPEELGETPAYGYWGARFMD